MTFKACDADNTFALLIDVQEKLFPKIYKCDELKEKITLLLKGLKALGIPILRSEQYPKGLGKTIFPLEEYADNVFEKTTFSCMQDTELASEIQKFTPKSCIAFGIETHICVLQTVRNLIENGFSVIVCQDATSSRNEIDKQSALSELGRMGARITTCETILFEMLQAKEHPQFKTISQCVK